MSHKKKKKAPEENELMSLQITSMADIFTIILVFLLKSFATSSIALSPGVQLPHVNMVDKTIFKESITVEIQESLLLLDQKPLLKLKHFFADMSPSQALRDLHETEITSLLNAAFDELKKRNSTVITDKGLKITIMADQNAPYVTIQEVISVAARHGFKTCQLVMVKDA